MFAGGCVNPQPAPPQPPPPIRMFALGGELEEGGHREQGTRRRLCRLRGVGVCRVCPKKPTFCKHDCLVLQVAASSPVTRQFLEL